MPVSVYCVRVYSHMLLALYIYRYIQTFVHTGVYTDIRKGRFTVNPIKLETGSRPNTAGIPYTLLLRIEATGFPTFGFLLYTISMKHVSVWIFLSPLSPSSFCLLVCIYACICICIHIYEQAARKCTFTHD